MVVVATRFTDGTKLNIETTYTDPDPFTVQPKVEEQKVVEEPKKPLRDLTPRENVTITPQQDKYRQVGLQKREPAYVRLRSQFEVESDSQQKVNYQQQSVVREEYATKDGNGELF